MKNENLYKILRTQYPQINWSMYADGSIRGVFNGEYFILEQESDIKMIDAYLLNNGFNEDVQLALF